MSDDLKRIQELFAIINNDYPDANSQLVIETLDNPGWMATLDARDLGLDAAAIPASSIDDERGWLYLRDADGKLTVAGGPFDLDRVLHTVRTILDDFLATKNA
jgi:hypothetical protein